MAENMRLSVLLNKAETMRDARELLDWAFKNEITLTKDRAALLIRETHERIWANELSDEALGAVTGGIVTKCKMGRCYTNKPKPDP